MTGRDLVVDPFFAFFTVEDSGFADDLDMAGHRGLRHVEDVGKLANAERLIEDKLHDAPAGLIRKGMGVCNDVFHDEVSRNE